ncbi:sensor histidine kinase [Massilia sp. DWR3-1-1]|uniref:sensor histidine kinase n=1 Tax=Massilia sp. DWR3-1-1 TaxID=2804559 RepID=UPI003CF47AFC
MSSKKSVQAAHRNTPTDASLSHRQCDVPAGAVQGGGASTSRRFLPGRRRQDIVRDKLLACERRQLARQIHDDLGAALTGIKSCISVAIARELHRGEVANTLLYDAEILAEAAFTTICKIGTDLRPTLLEQMGMWGALAWQAKSLARRSSIQVTFHTDASLECLPFVEEYARIIYRVVSEAITNAEKHSHASHLNLRVYQRDQLLIAVAQDDGVGAPAADVRGGGSLGMVGMREQVAEAGGLLSVDTHPGHGMCISLAIPLGYCYGR